MRDAIILSDNLYIVYVFHIQFKYADVFDIIMILLAILMSIASGLASPVTSFLTGRLFNSFISYRAAQDYSFVATIFNGSCTTTLVQDFLTNATNSSVDVFCDVTQEGNIFNSASDFICDPEVTLVKQVTESAIYFAILAGVVLLSYSLAHLFWGVSAHRQSKRIRIAFYQAVLRHEVGWFETTKTSHLGSLFVT